MSRDPRHAAPESGKEMQKTHQCQASQKRLSPKSNAHVSLCGNGKKTTIFHERMSLPRDPHRRQPCPIADFADRSVEEGSVPSLNHERPMPRPQHRPVRITRCSGSKLPEAHCKSSTRCVHAWTWPQGPLRTGQARPVAVPSTKP